jgi:hypothetical protein
MWFATLKNEMYFDAIFSNLLSLAKQKSDLFFAK